MYMIYTQSICEVFYKVSDLCQCMSQLDRSKISFYLFGLYDHKWANLTIRMSFESGDFRDSLEPSHT